MLKPKPANIDLGRVLKHHHIVMVIELRLAMARSGRLRIWASIDPYVTSILLIWIVESGWVLI